MPSGPQRVAAFGIVAVMLIVAADNPTTAPLAVAFAYLFLISTLYLVGPVAFGRLQSLIGVTPESSSGAGSGGAGGGHRK